MLLSCVDSQTPTLLSLLSFLGQQCGQPWGPPCVGSAPAKPHSHPAGGRSDAETRALTIVFLITFILHFQPNQTSGNCPAEAAPCKTPSAPTQSLLLPALTSASPTAGSGPGKSPSPTEPLHLGERLWAPSLDSRASLTVTHALQLPRDPATQPSCLTFGFPFLSFSCLWSSIRRC